MLVDEHGMILNRFNGLKGLLSLFTVSLIERAVNRPGSRGIRQSPSPEVIPLFLKAVQRLVENFDGELNDHHSPNPD